MGLRHPRCSSLVLLVVVTLCACGGGFADPVVERVVASAADAENLTAEEAGLIASGELVEIYGPEADPVPVHVEVEITELDGQRVWQLDLRVDVSFGDTRTEREWRMWVGTPAGGEPDVLRAQERR